MRSLRATLATHSKIVVDLVFPPLCLICGKRMQDEAYLCKNCLDGFVLRENPVDKFSISGEVYITTTWALFDFDANFQSLIHHLKYSRKRKPIIRTLDYYESQIMDLILHPTYDYVVPVPLHPRKQRERGYNQTQVVCEWFAPRMKAQLGGHLVVRTTYTRSQTKLNALEREKNVQKAFKYSGKAELAGASILIIDDVLTTGATSNALAHELLNNGAGGVDLITLSSPA
ncbi:MAG: double zinc ribbon domain-containing protein [Candidatus Marinimicrobia bacterium]|nr:double zinc ribbon domain-containing protein [Candidatus Neomarinimicrobiota bacterium]MCF7850542.1 double zinc ribbon domain-containing protein [Candidatus Neomarinimicrobiota bacterium]MCF7904116.1 double zinc ribbon domain-containing protein [Candidatus Neomarinimicrobiota bacterium]